MYPLDKTKKPKTIPSPHCRPFDKDLWNTVALLLTPDPMEFKFDDGISFFAKECKPVMNMARVCKEWATCLTLPSMVKHPVQRRYPPKPACYSDAWHFIVRANGMTMKYTGRILRFKNPYKRDNIKKRLANNILDAMAPIKLKMEKGALFNTFELNAEILADLAKKEEEYRITTMGEDAKIKGIKNEILRCSLQLGCMRPFLEIEIEQQPPALKCVGCTFVTAFDFLTTEEVNLEMVDIWSRLSRSIRPAIQDRIMGRAYYSETNYRQLLEGIIFWEVTHTLTNDQKPLRGTLNLDEKIENIQTMLFSVYDKCDSTSYSEIMTSMNDECVEKGMWLNWMLSDDLINNRRSYIE